MMGNISAPVRSSMYSAILPTSPGTTTLAWPRTSTPMSSRLYSYALFAQLKYAIIILLPATEPSTASFGLSAASLITSDVWISSVSDMGGGPVSDQAFCRPFPQPDRPIAVHKDRSIHSNIFKCFIPHRLTRSWQTQPYPGSPHPRSSVCRYPAL